MKNKLSLQNLQNNSRAHPLWWKVCSEEVEFNERSHTKEGLTHLLYGRLHALGGPHRLADLHETQATLVTHISCTDDSTLWGDHTDWQIYMKHGQHWLHTSPVRTTLHSEGNKQTGRST